MVSVKQLLVIFYIATSPAVLVYASNFHIFDHIILQIVMIAGILCYDGTQLFHERTMFVIIDGAQMMIVFLSTLNTIIACCTIENGVHLGSESATILAILAFPILREMRPSLRMD